MKTNLALIAIALLIPACGGSSIGSIQAAPKAVHLVSSFSGDIACKLKKSGSQNVQHNEFAVFVAFDDEDYDTAGMHSTTVNNSRATITEDGTYQIHAEVCWNTDASGSYFLEIVKNGGEVLATDVRNGGSGYFTINHSFAEDAFVTGDYVRLLVIQTTGSERSILSSLTRLYVRKVN